MSRPNDTHKNEAVADSLESRDGTNMSGLYPTTTLSPEVFERLYLQPKPSVGGDLRKIVANPTPLAIAGFCVGLTPISAQLMGWGGSGGGGVATTTGSIWFGGLLLILAGLMEFLLGNTFTFIVFMSFGAHFLTFATSAIPWFNAVASYTVDGVESPMFPAGQGVRPFWKRTLQTLADAAVRIL